MKRLKRCKDCARPIREYNKSGYCCHCITIFHRKLLTLRRKMNGHREEVLSRTPFLHPVAT